MKFKTFGGLEFLIKEDYIFDKKTRKTFDVILKPVFDYLGIGNARLWLLINKTNLKIVYGFTNKGFIPKKDYQTIYDTTEQDKDILMINLLKKNPAKFDEEYTKRIFSKTGANFEEIKKKITTERLEGKIKPKFFIGKRKNHLQWVYEEQEPIQICDNPSHLLTLKAKGIIYGNLNEHGIYIRTREERLLEVWKKNKKLQKQYKNFSRFYYAGAFPLYITEDHKKIGLGILEVDELEDIISGPTKPIDKTKFNWAFDIINNTITPISLAQFVDTKNEDFLRYMAESLKKVSDLKDYYGGEHSERVRTYSLIVGKALYSIGKLNKKRLFNLELASMLHDIGKLAIKENILRKQTILTKEERKIMQQHPLYAKKILSSMKHFKNLIPIIISHHERYDGKGYPKHKKREEIPIESRIIALADTLDAITFGRPYRDIRSRDDAIKEIKKGRGTQFDPYIADIFIKAIQEV